MPVELYTDPVQPYHAQGVAVIGALFSYVSSILQVPALLHAYEDLRFVSLFSPSPPPFHSITTNQANRRLTRATVTQDSFLLNQKIFHLPDGPDQRARDDGGRIEGPEGKPIPGRNPKQWVDRTKSQIRFGI